MSNHGIEASVCAAMYASIACSALLAGKELDGFLHYALLCLAYVQMAKRQM